MGTAVGIGKKFFILFGKKYFIWEVEVKDFLLITSSETIFKIQD